MISKDMAIVLAIPIVISTLFLVACLALWLHGRHRHDFGDQELGTVAVPLGSEYNNPSITAPPTAKTATSGSPEMPSQPTPAFTNGSILSVARATQGPLSRVRHNSVCETKRVSSIFTTQPTVRENTPFQEDLGDRPLLERDSWEYHPPRWI